MPSATKGAAGAGVLGGWNYYTVFGVSPNTPAVFDVTQGSLYSYVKSKGVYVCPDDGVGQKNGASYSYSSCAEQFTAPTGTALYPGKSLSQFDNPSGMLLLTEEADGGGSFSTNDGYFLFKFDTVALRHSGGVNGLFLDGHAKYSLVDNTGETVASTGDNTKIWNLQNGFDLNNTQNMPLPAPGTASPGVGVCSN